MIVIVTAELCCKSWYNHSKT